MTIPSVVLICMYIIFQTNAHTARESYIKIWYQEGNT